jgi:hypothetical protein
MVAAVVPQGFDAMATGGSTLLDPTLRRPLVAVDRAAEERVIARSFAGKVAHARAGRLMALARDWGPDLIVRDETDFAAAVVGDVLETPHAAVIVLAAGGFVRPDLVEGPLASLRAEHGLGQEGSLAMLHRYLTLVPVPPIFRDPRDRLLRTAHHVRPAALEDNTWAREPRGPFGARAVTPTVYFTLGTIFHQESGDLFKRVVAGLGQLPVEVVVTVGREIDPGELGEQPSNVRVEQFVPVAEVLARSDIVVSHGGSGTVIGALAFGLPQVLLPMGADQPLNADRCEALGVATVLDALNSTSAEIGEATAMVLEHPAYRSQAELVQDEIRSLPDAQHAGSLLEELARSGTAVLNK